MDREHRLAIQPGFLRVSALLLLCFVAPGCRKQPPKAPPSVQAPLPAPEVPLSTAEQAFRDGRCVDAVSEYTRYLQENPAAPDGDAALLRIAICRLLPQSATHDEAEGLRVLNNLLARFPNSSSRPYVEVILDANAQVRGRLAELEQCNANLRSASAELESARKAEGTALGQIQQLESNSAKEMKAKDARIRQLTATIEELEARIRSLSEDLDALKKIDLQRRPSRPSP